MGVSCRIHHWLGYGHDLICVETEHKMTGETSRNDTKGWMMACPLGAEKILWHPLSPHATSRCLFFRGLRLALIAGLKWAMDDYPLVI